MRLGTRSACPRTACCWDAAREALAREHELRIEDLGEIDQDAAQGGGRCGELSQDRGAPFYPGVLAAL